MSTNKIQINLSMAEITRSFITYKKAYNEPTSPETNLTFSVDLYEMGLDSIIREYEFQHYDSQSYNKAFMEMLEKGKNHNASFIYDASIYSRYRQVILKYMKNIPDVTLQIGPGGSLGCEVLLCLLGVKKAYTLDHFPLLTFNLDDVMRSLQMLFEIIRWLGGINKFNPSALIIPDFKTIDKGHYCIGNSAIRHYYPRAFECTGFDDETIDFLFSHATFEHVRDPWQCVREIRRVLKPEGITAHCIDLRDHRNFDQPLRFLRDSEGEWMKIMEEYCRYDSSGYMNRWRASEFRNAFEREGFEILEFNADMKISEETLKAELPYFDKKYRSFPEKDLCIATLSIVARKA